MLIVLLVLLVVGAVLSIYIVPQQNIFIIERLGRYCKSSSAGLNVKIPFIDNVAGKLDLRTQQRELKLDAKTKDNVIVGLQVAVQYRVDDTDDDSVYAAFYSLANPVDQMVSYITDSLRASIPKYSLDEVFDKKSDIADDVKKDVSETMSEYGYLVDATLIQDIELPADVKAAMNDINTAQRKKTAAQSLAEAEKIKVVTEAEAKAAAAEEAGKGIANQRKQIAIGINESIETIRKSGMTESEANMLFMFTQWTDMMSEFAKSGQASTVLLPSDFKESASMFESMVSAGAVSTSTDEDVAKQLFDRV